MRKYLLSVLFVALTSVSFGQEEILSFSEYLGYVKKYHPIVKQANLVIDEGEAKLLKARGSFDPKFEVDYDNKNFKNTEYFDHLNAAFKIPTWYGVGFKADFEQNDGAFLNAENNVPTNGLYNVGVSISLAKGLLINERMATLKQAKLFQKQAEADNQLLVNNVLYNASKAYFDWLKFYQDKTVYEEFLDNAELRLDGIILSYEMGERPAIDTTEARIAFNNRKLNLEKAKLNYVKSVMDLSNFLWIEDVPVEIQDNIIPDTLIGNFIDDAFQLNISNLTIDLNSHPKLQSLNYKYLGLENERLLQRNNLLPQIDLEYNFLSETPEQINSFNTTNYKTGLVISFPLFLRKERAELRLANYKLMAIDFDRQATTVALENKLSAVLQEITSYETQINIADNIVSDYSTLLKGEERKFEIGESSLFLINSRESKLIENQLKRIELENFFLKSKGKLFNLLVN